MTRTTLLDVFVVGARKGWAMAVNNILPNVLMAFVLIHFLKLIGVLGLMGKVFGPLMGVFGLPGEAVAVLIASWLAMGGGVGVAASLYGAGTLSASHVSILLPAILLMGAQVQYMGRLLGTAGVQVRYYPMLFTICIVNALIAMLIMRLFV